MISPSIRSESGFTLVEILMVIILVGTLAVVSITPIRDSIDEGRFQETVARMKAIRDATLGDPTLREASRTSFGFLGDVGSIPTAAQGLQALVTNPGLPVWAMDAAVRFGRGWNGPYLTSSDAGANLTRDAWGNNFVYSPTAVPPAIVSLGSDGAAGGTGFNSDITVTLPTELQRATVHGFISQGGGPYTGTATVVINHLNGAGALATSTVNLVAANNGYFSFNNIAFGKRSVIFYIPNITSPTQTIGPIVFTVDVPNYTIPSSALDIGQAPGAAPGICNNPAGKIIYVSGTGAVASSGGFRNLTLQANITGPVTVTQMNIQSVSDAAPWRAVTAQGRTYNCPNAFKLDPCPAPNLTTITLTPTWNLTAGNNQVFTVQFSPNVSQENTVIAVFFHNFGCDVLNITGL
jgi:general secretion pathway protein G